MAREQSAKSRTLADLRKLEITCFVPTWLPEGYRLKSVSFDRSDRDGLHDDKAPGFAAYSLEYTDGKRGRFTIESARIGIGDRNLDDDPQAEESQFQTKAFGEVYIIYVPGGRKGVKKRIAANWVEDANLKAETAKGKDAPRVKGRYHGFSGYGMTVADFEKIVQSLRPARER